MSAILFPYEPPIGTLWYHASKIWIYDGNGWTPRATPSGVPPGTIIYTAKVTAPYGYLIANGAAISRTEYLNLYTEISTIYGVGDGSTTFNLPNCCGYFIRSADLGYGIDPDGIRSPGNIQLDTFKAHTHNVGNQSNTQYQALAGEGYGLITNTGPVPSGSTGGSETRPKNLAFIACIKV